MSTEFGIVVSKLTSAEQFTANSAWYLAYATYTPQHVPAAGVFFSLNGTGQPVNYRMQSFIREWAAFGYAPAQTLLAKIAAKRLSP